MAVAAEQGRSPAAAPAEAAAAFETLRRAVLVLGAVNVAAVGALGWAGGGPWAWFAVAVAVALVVALARLRHAERIAASTVEAAHAAALAEARAEAQAARRRLEDAIDALPAGFELYDPDDRMVLANRVLRAMYPQIAHLMTQGLTFEQLVRANHAAGALRVPGPFEPWLAERIAARRNGGTALLHQLEDGRWIRSHERLTGDGWLVGVRLDVTELVAQQARAEAATRRLHEAIEALTDGFALYDADDRLVVFNRRYSEIYAESAAAIRAGATFEAMLRYGLERGQYVDAIGREAEWLAARLHRHRHPGPPELQQLPGNRWLRIDERVTADGGIAGVRTDVTELVRREQELQQLNAQLDEANARLRQLSDTDDLTSVANRRQFDRRLAEEWARAARRGTPLALLLVDVDHFKHFNDTQGHPGGDDCLRRVAAALLACARRASDLVARYGGEEFALLLPDADAAQAGALAEHCVAQVRALRIANAGPSAAGVVTISVGVACRVPVAGGNFGELLRDADRALYEAKAAGRDRVAVAAPG